MSAAYTTVDLGKPGALEQLKNSLGLGSMAAKCGVTGVMAAEPAPQASKPEPMEQPTAPINNEVGKDITFVDPLPEAPQSLKDISNWVRWKYETGDDGKPTKVPYQVNGYKASSTNSNTWVDYHTAVAGATIDNTQGVGFVVNGDFVGVDLDGCRNPETEEVVPWAERIVDALNSYTEITPSQTGLRVWVRGQLPGKDKVFNLDPAAGVGDKVKIEVFTDGRYFTVTGNSIYEGLVEVEKRDLTKVYKMFQEIRAQYPAPKKSSDTSTNTTGATNESVPVEKAPGVFHVDKLTILMKGSIKSESPFVVEYNGNSVEYSSHSEADLALVTCLALKHDNPDTIWDEYTKSSLVREKWLQRKDDFYRLTIAKAIESAKAVLVNEAAAKANEREDGALIQALAEDYTPPVYAMTPEEVAVEEAKDFPVFFLPPHGGPTWDDSILYGPIGEITKKAVQYSESHPAGVYLDLLISIGSIIGRNPYFNINATKHYTNEFLVRVGPTSKSRKGGGRDQVDTITSLLDFEWLHKRTMSGFGSGESVINEIRDSRQEQVRNRQKGAGDFRLIIVPGVDDKRLCVRTGEIAGTFEVASRPGSLMSVIFRDGWDGKPLMNRVKGKTSDGLSNSAVCQDPHLSISGDCTKEELVAKMLDDWAENGFGNRFLYCWVYRTKMCPLGGPEIVWAN